MKEIYFQGFKAFQPPNTKVNFILDFVAYLVPPNPRLGIAR